MRTALPFCIAKAQFAYRHAQGVFGSWALISLLTGGPDVHANPAAAATAAASAPSAPAPGVGAASAVPPARRWVPVPRTAGRLHAPDLGLVINMADPYSVEVGEYYTLKRGLKPEQVLRLELPPGPALSPAEFAVLRARVDAHFGPATQALALAWVTPYAVACNSITSALALGLDEGLCRQTCAPGRPSAYANARTHRPFTDLGIRPAMLIAARSIEQARALIDRGVASDGTLGRRGGAPVQALFVSTADITRNVRSSLYPPAGRSAAMGVDFRTLPLAELGEQRHVFLAQLGAARLPALEPLDWVPGALGDHLTSFGGRLTEAHGQSTALEWIAAGATASHGTVSEPCAHLQKFPHPQWLALHYLQGSTAIEAYWKSVRWPQQGLFIGEPLAAPFSR